MSSSTYKYINIKEGELKTISKNKIYNGTGGMCNVYVSVLRCLFKQPGLNPLPSNYRELNVRAQRCANKRRESMWLLTIENLHPALQRSQEGKTPLSQGCARASAVPMYHSSCSHDTRSVCEAAGQEGKFAVGGEMV